MLYPRIAEAQPEVPKFDGETTSIFSNLIRENNLSCFKAGLVCSAQRNDTIFAVFYQSTLNNFICLPLGCINDTSKLDCYEGTKEPYLHRLKQPSGILCSRFIAAFKLKQEAIYVFEQVLSEHITLKSGDTISTHQKSRLIYYSRKKGIYKIDYADDYVDDAPSFQWPYTEGDFIF